MKSITITSLAVIAVFNTKLIKSGLTVNPFEFQVVNGFVLGTFTVLPPSNILTPFM